jgi:Asp-tRNA(Asn)/Glu-tRNA(Gln) amidotransferase A subunit family amidase
VSVDPYNALITRVDPDPDAEPSPGPLSGKRLLVKDLIDTAGIRTTYGSRIYRDHVPGRTAPSVNRLLDAGALLVGKGNLPEFAWAVMGQNPFYGTVHNPVAPGKTTGGSSSGNAAALAADLCDIALGTDTGCSIRLPSACCETVGLKPRWGSIDMEGVFPLCPTLDTLGPMARSVEDVALVWSLLKDAPIPAPRLDGLTVGLLRRPPTVGDGRATEPSDLAEGWGADLERLGARVVEAHVPEPSANTWPLFNHEALQSHRATFPSRAEEYSDVCRTKLEIALRTTADEVEEAYRALVDWRRFEPEVDLYIAPCYTQELPAEDADELEVRLRFSEFLRWVNLIGWAGLAIGNLQLIAPHDETVLAAGLAWARG